MKKFIPAVIISFALLFFLFPVFQSHAVSSLEPNRQHVITLSTPWKDYKINLKDYELKTNNFGILSSARRRIKGRTVEEKISYMSKLRENNLDSKTALSQVFIGIESQIEKIFKNIEVLPANAKMHFNPHREVFSFTPERHGTKIDRQEFYDHLAYIIEAGKNNLKIKTRPHHPSLTVEKLRSATYLRAGFKTSFETSGPDRKHNIALSMSKLDGKAIYPGETLSFNAATGRRTAQNGYREAKILIDGVYTDGFGGGVCQVSTTLYNAALLAGLDPQGSRGHSRPASYVPPGLDAMVSGASADLIIKNNLTLPIAIKATTTENTALIEIFGTSLGYTSYSLSTELIEELPPKPREYKKDKTKPRGTELREGQAGFSVQSYRHTYLNDILQKTERVRKTTYDSISEIISIK